MNLLEECLIEFANNRGNNVKEGEVDDDLSLMFTLLDMQEFAIDYHEKEMNVISEKLNK